MPVDRDYAFPEPRPGMDHDHYDWSPLNASRAPLRWPEQRPRGAVRHRHARAHGVEPAAGQLPARPTLAGGYGRRPFPTSPAGRIASTATASASSACSTCWKSTASRPPSPWTRSPPSTIRSWCATASSRGCRDHRPRHLGEPDDHQPDVGGGGARLHPSVRRSADPRHRARRRPAGSGPSPASPTRTPRLLAEAGIRYVCDWVNDEQPYPHEGAPGRAARPARSRCRWTTSTRSGTGGSISTSTAG